MKLSNIKRVTIADNKQEMESSIEVKLLNSGRYTWKITIIFNEQDPKAGQDAVILSREIDKQLRSEYPDAVTRGSGRTSYIEED